MNESVEVIKYIDGEKSTEVAQIAQEAPLTIKFNGREMSTLLSSPAHWDELAVGFLLSEGLLKPQKENLKVQIDYQDGMAWVDSPHVDKATEKTWQKRFITSGCGSGSGNSFYSLAGSRQMALEGDEATVTVPTLKKLIKELNHASELYSATHGVHGAALAKGDKLEVFREDVGRHNALDKIRGHCFLKELPSRNKILLSTGRISSEMLLKAARLQTPIVVSRSAPTTLAIEHAKKLNLTLVGMVRGRQLTVYTVQQRVR